jgi:nitroreductase
MDIIQAIKTRKSIRGYRKDSISDGVLEEILETAVRAPSASNSQPWHITVVAGKALDDLRIGNIEALSRVAGTRTGEHPLEGKYRERQVELAKQLYTLLDIKREDREKRFEWVKDGCRYFGAPAVIFISSDESLTERQSYFDCGLLTQTICLAALNYGLGTCIMLQGIMFPDAVRRITGIPISERLIISIALGYPDTDFPANRLKSEREPVENTVSMVK